MQSGRVARSMLFFSTKAGFFDSDSLQKLLSKGTIGHDDIMGGVHCIHPACLEMSLARSLQDMHLDTVSSGLSTDNLTLRREAVSKNWI